SQPRQRCNRNRFGIDLEVTAQVLAVVATTESVRPQRFHPAGQPRGDLIGDYFHVIRGGYDGPFRAFQSFQDIRFVRGLIGMQTVPALDPQGIAAQFVVAGHAPDVGRHVVLFRQDLLRAERFVQDRAAAEKLQARFAVFRGLESVNALQDAFCYALRHRRHRVILVVEREVVEQVLLLLVHAADAVLNDDGDLVSVRGIVCGTGGYGAGKDDAVAVLVLQTLACQRRAPGSAAHQEALAPRIGKGPNQIADPLEPKHRVVRKERDHLHAVIRVSGPGRAEGSHGPGFRDALFQDLTVFGFLVIEEHLRVVRLIELALAGVDAELAKQRLHAERAGFVRDDGNDSLPDLRVLQQQRQDADERHRCGYFTALRTGDRFGKRL